MAQRYNKMRQKLTVYLSYHFFFPQLFKKKKKRTSNKNKPMDAASQRTLFIVCLVEYLKDVLEKKMFICMKKTEAEANLYMLCFFIVFFLLCFKIFLSAAGV